MKAISIKGLLYLLFQTDMLFCLQIGVILVAVAFVGGLFLWKTQSGVQGRAQEKEQEQEQGSEREQEQGSKREKEQKRKQEREQEKNQEQEQESAANKKTDVYTDGNAAAYRGEKGFALLCIAAIFVIYLTALILSSFANHFFVARHIMHAAGMMWLGVAICLPRINWQVYAAGLVVLLSVCYANYQREYESTYRDTPYLEDTKEFIRTQMEPGDTVIYSSPWMYRRLYLCYMPEQEFVWLNDMKDEDIQALAGKRVWYFSTNWREYFTEEQIQRFRIHAENVGHYGFQIMDNVTDFDLLRLQIDGEG